MLYSLLGFCSHWPRRRRRRTQPHHRYYEQLATSDIPKDRESALSSLRPGTRKKDLRMECADQRSADCRACSSVSTMQPHANCISPSPANRISNSETADVTMQVDEYVHNHVVGVNPGLFSYKIESSRHIEWRFASSCLDWTFVFKKDPSRRRGQSDNRLCQRARWYQV